MLVCCRKYLAHTVLITRAKAVVRVPEIFHILFYIHYGANSPSLYIGLETV